MTYFSFIVLAALVVLLESAYSYFRKLGYYDFRETRITLLILGGSALIGLATILFIPDVTDTLVSHRLFRFSFSPWVNYLAALFIADFAYYLGHRLSHETRVGWASHFVHHTPLFFNFSVGLRLPLLRIFSLIYLVHFFPLFLGVPPKEYIVCYSFIISIQTLLHTHLVPRLGWFDLFFNTPSNHRVHHGLNPTCINKNYGGVFMVFDHLFGTYAREDLALNIQYGVSQPPERNTLWQNLLQGWKLLYLDLRRAPFYRWPSVFFGSP